LTDLGREIHRRNFEAFAKECPGFQYPYSEPVEDENGWSKWQLWHLMKEFGPNMSMASGVPFETIIEMELEST